MRTWIGHKILAPKDIGEYYKDELYPLCFVPEKKASLQDTMELIRNRYEGTEYSPDETGRTDMRVVGTDTALSVHIAQIYPDLPADMSCVTWESTGLDYDEACRYITKYCNNVQMQAFKDAGQILNDVRWYRSTNSNTMKNGRNPETHEIIDELKPVAPLELDLDNSVYSKVP